MNFLMRILALNTTSYILLNLLNRNKYVSNPETDGPLLFPLLTFFLHFLYNKFNEMIVNFISNKIREHLII